MATATLQRLEMPDSATSMQALASWYRVSADCINELPHELTMRQWAILVHVYLIDDIHTVKSLAYTFDIPKPAVCRALDALSIMGLLRRKKDESDKRNVIIQKTLQGIGFLNHFNDILDKHMCRTGMHDTPTPHKQGEK